MTGEDSKNNTEELAAREPIENLIDTGDNPSISASTSGNRINDMLNEQDQEAEEYAIKFLTSVLRLRGVRVEREHFLRTELHKRGISKAEIGQAIQHSPAAAGLNPVLLDEIAKASIDFERNKSSTLSFAAGVPGGFAMLATVPGDITQFYVHVFRVMQKLAYVYGWQSFLDDTEKIDDETLGKLAGFLGVMMGIAGASGSLRHFALNIARPAVEKKIANVALTKTVWYLPMKQTLRVIGVNVTKQSLARTVTKVVPLVGGVVSGSFTFVVFNSQSKRLMQHLRELPPPNVDAAEYLAAVKNADSTSTEQNEQRDRSDEKNSSRTTSAKRIAQGAAPALKNAGSAIAGKLGGLRRSARQKSTPTEETTDN